MCTVSWSGGQELKIKVSVGLVPARSSGQDLRDSRPPPGIQGLLACLGGPRRDPLPHGSLHLSSYEDLGHRRQDPPNQVGPHWNLALSA